MVLHKEGIEPYRRFTGVILHKVMHLVHPIISGYFGGKTGVYLRPQSLRGFGFCRRLRRLAGFRRLLCCR